VKLIQAALQAGFTLAEITGIFAERRAGRAPCRRVRALAADKRRAPRLVEPIAARDAKHGDFKITATLSVLEDVLVGAHITRAHSTSSSPGRQAPLLCRARTSLNEFLSADSKGGLLQPPHQAQLSVHEARGMTVEDHRYPITDG
jgi:hypothetical protein